jgi:hypothetical protein
MRFVEPKSVAQQARAVADRTPGHLVKQRTETVNAMRSHLYEFGHVAHEGICSVPRLAKLVDDPDTRTPDPARDVRHMLLEQIAHLTARIDALNARIAALSNQADLPRQLQTVQGVGPITARAAETVAQPVEQIRRGRNFAARPHPKAAFPRRQAGAGEDLEDGTTRYPAVAGDRDDRGDPLGLPARGAERILAVADARTQADTGHGRGAGEQDGARDPGDADAP